MAVVVAEVITPQLVQVLLVAALAVAVLVKRDIHQQVSDTMLAAIFFSSL